ncbi:hypothetical protein OF83DRAFT_1285717 [Amylostereum chailletii]|nr:hypothetical protein OF83DRAFT_1285717 [Amylostereum chailletii]
MASTAQPQQPITIIDTLSRVWKPLPIVLGILLILTLILVSYFVRVLAVKLAKRWMKSARAKALPRQLVLPTVHAQRVTPSKTPSRISPTRALASIRAPLSNTRAGAAICKAASCFAIGKFTRSMYRVPPMPASYGDSEGMKTVWAESWPLLRAQDRRERKVAFLHLSRATFASFVDSVLSPFTALRRLFGTVSFSVLSTRLDTHIHLFQVQRRRSPSSRRS